MDGAISGLGSWRQRRQDEADEARAKVEALAKDSAADELDGSQSPSPREVCAAPTKYGV